MTTQEALLIGGRAGSGGSTAGHEASRLPRAAGVSRCLIEGDDLCEAHPMPADDPHGTAMTEANLAALWADYRGRGHRRLVRTNSVCVLERDLVTRAMGGGPVRVIGVVPTAGGDTVRRPAGRERGSGSVLPCETPDTRAPDLTPCTGRGDSPPEQGVSSSPKK